MLLQQVLVLLLPVPVLQPVLVPLPVGVVLQLLARLESIAMAMVPVDGGLAVDSDHDRPPNWCALGRVLPRSPCIPDTGSPPKPRLGICKLPVPGYGPHGPSVSSFCILDIPAHSASAVTSLPLGSFSSVPEPSASVSVPVVFVCPKPVALQVPKAIPAPPQRLCLVV